MRPGLAQFPSGPTAPQEKITLSKAQPVTATDYKGLTEWYSSLDRYAQESAGGGQPKQVLDFTSQNIFLKELIKTRPVYLWPEGLYIPAGVNYQNYWFEPCPASHRYSKAWNSGFASNEATVADGHVWAYSFVDQFTPHNHSEAGIGFVFTPTAKLAFYSVQPTMSAVGTFRVSVISSLNGGGWIYEWGAIYIAAWIISPIDGSLELVTPKGYQSTTVFNGVLDNEGTQAITTIIPPWSPGSQTMNNLLLEGGQSYLIGIIAAVDVTNTWNIPQGQWRGSDWRNWCMLDLLIPQIIVDPTMIVEP